MSMGAALCRNALRCDYSARDAIEDRELAEATRILTQTYNQKQKGKQK